jgi:hypothetical protein
MVPLLGFVGGLDEGGEGPLEGFAEGDTVVKEVGVEAGLAFDLECCYQLGSSWDGTIDYQRSLTLHSGLPEFLLHHHQRQQQ